MSTVADRLKLLSGLSGVSAATMLLAIGTGSTAGEILADHSSLPTSSALTHLLADGTGESAINGTGDNTVLFYSTSTGKVLVKSIISGTIVDGVTSSASGTIPVSGTSNTTSVVISGGSGDIPVYGDTDSYTTMFGEGLGSVSVTGGSSFSIDDVGSLGLTKAIATATGTNTTDILSNALGEVYWASISGVSDTTVSLTTTATGAVHVSGSGTGLASVLGVSSGAALIQGTGLSLVNFTSSGEGSVAWPVISGEATGETEVSSTALGTLLVSGSSAYSVALESVSSGTVSLSGLGANTLPDFLQSSLGSVLILGDGYSEASVSSQGYAWAIDLSEYLNPLDGVPGQGVSVDARGYTIVTELSGDVVRSYSPYSSIVTYTPSSEVVTTKLYTVSPSMVGWITPLETGGVANIVTEIASSSIVTRVPTSKIASYIMVSGIDTMVDGDVSYLRQRYSVVKTIGYKTY